MSASFSKEHFREPTTLKTTLLVFSLLEKAPTPNYSKKYYSCRSLSFFLSFFLFFSFFFCSFFGLKNDVSMNVEIDKFFCSSPSPKKTSCLNVRNFLVWAKPESAN